MRQSTWQPELCMAMAATRGIRQRLPHRRPIWCGLAAWATLMMAASVCQARDRIVLQAPEKTTPLAISGDVANYNAERIEIHLTVGNPVHEYAAAEVVSVETVQTDAHRAGVRHFRDGDMDAAQGQFEQALQDEPRQWVRREILGWLIKIAMRRGDRAQAGKLFLQILHDETAPREYALVPLVWSAASINSNLHQHGRLWLTGATAAERLLGASVLLLDQRYGDTARTELDRLARVTDTRVASLARAQLWRLRVAAPDVSDNELASWEQTISRLPPELRAGPMYLLGRAALHRSEYDRAAAAFMWLPTVYSENEVLTAQAAIGAVTALQRIGRLSDARPLLEELTSVYNWSPVAAEARALLAELETTAAR